MNACTITPDTSELLFLPSSPKVQFRQWTERGEKALWASIPSSQLLDFTQEVVREQDAARIHGTSSIQRDDEKINVIPSIEGFNLHNPALTSIVRTLLGNFWAIIVSKALQTSFPITKTVIAVFNDQTEDRQQVVLRLFTEANATQAIAFWESLEGNIQEWIRGLGSSSRTVFIRNISLRIHWR